MTVLSLCVAGITIHCKSSANTCLSTEEDFSLKGSIPLQRSVSRLSNIELTSTELSVEESSDSLWQELFLNNRLSDNYEIKDPNHDLLEEKFDSLSHDLGEQSLVIFNKAPPLISRIEETKSVYANYFSNSSFQNKIIVNRTLYGLYLEPIAFKNICISVSVK